MVLAAIGTSSGSMPVSAITLNNGSGHNNIFRSVLSFGWHDHICLHYKIPPVADVNRSFLQILFAVVLRIRFEGSAYRTIFLVSDYFSREVLIGTHLTKHQFESICYINSQVAFTRDKIPLLESAYETPSLKGFESIKDD